MSDSYLYQWVLRGPCLSECVSSLSDESLCRLSGWLGREYDENGDSGKVLGLCLVEQAERFRREHGAGRPGNGLGQDVPATLEEGGKIL